MTLEKRIEAAIAENDCPHTTDADIRYYMMEDHKAMLRLRRTMPQDLEWIDFSDTVITSQSFK
jgi:hypothetical protein